MSNKEYSKYLSYILRHNPDEVGLTLDPNGWVGVDTLLAAIKKAGKNIDKDLLFNIVATSDKKRFTLSDDKLKIRAAQGHSITIDLNLVASIPPSPLYHGTALKNVDPIMRDGIIAGQRDKVHLSSDIETALKVGQRHGKPVVFQVDTKAMEESGKEFWRADNGVWLADYIAPQYISLLSLK